MNSIQFYSLLVLATAVTTPAFTKALHVGQHSAGPQAPQSFTIIDEPNAGSGFGQGTWVTYVDSNTNAAGGFIDSAGNTHTYFLPSGGTFTQIDVKGTTTQTTVVWTNERNTISGVYLDPDTNTQQGFLRMSSGKIETFDASGGSAFGTSAVTVNNRNVAAGWFVDQNEVNHAFVRTTDGTITEFDEPNAGTSTAQGTLAFGINNSGTIVGDYADSGNVYHGYARLSNNTFIEIDAPCAGKGSDHGTFAYMANNKGWIVGTVRDDSLVYHGFVRNPTGTMITCFDAPDAGSGNYQGTVASAINLGHEITGSYIDASGVLHGFVRSKSGVITEFDAPGHGTSSGLGTGAAQNNRNGVVAGYLQDNSGVYHGFLRFPARRELVLGMLAPLSGAHATKLARGDGR